MPHWNALVANLEMRGKGNFYDSRLDDAAQFPIAAANHFGHVQNNPDLITAKLPASSRLSALNFCSGAALEQFRPRCCRSRPGTLQW